MSDTEVRVIEIGAASPEVVRTAFVLPDTNPQPVFIPGSYNQYGDEEPVQWFSGEGPPPDFIPGARPGAMYIDTLTGTLYQLG